MPVDSQEDMPMTAVPMMVGVTEEHVFMYDTFWVSRVSASEPMAQRIAGVARAQGADLSVERNVQDLAERAATAPLEKTYDRKTLLRDASGVDTVRVAGGRIQMQIAIHAVSLAQVADEECIQIGRLEIAQLPLKGVVMRGAAWVLVVVPLMEN